MSIRAATGYSENPDTAAAVAEAVGEMLGGADAPCDLAMLFCTARHDAAALREAAANALGAATPIIGGGAIGAIVNDRFGYAGDQIGIAGFWWNDKSTKSETAKIVAAGALDRDEIACGRQLGAALRERQITADAPLTLFYDAIDRSAPDRVRLLSGARLLTGIKNELGFFPRLVGVGMMGDYQCSPTGQFLGDRTDAHHALAWLPPRALNLRNTIMHGCRPATDYYTVTAADGPVVLEVNHQPALTFFEKTLNAPAEQFPLSLILGVNNGDRYGAFDEDVYANHLILGLDRERGGVVLFEPDMPAGTEFQIMYNRVELDYIAPKIEALFAETLGAGERPVFALYIDCAGRAAGYGGDYEDATAVQAAVADRVPLLGIYSGVEIAPVAGRPRCLDWTGVFCLFAERRV